jgi:transcriptional regulator with XRE-family HTH domain
MRNKDDLKYLRVRLDYWMTRKGITVEELASTANVSTETLAKIRNRGHIPQPAVVKRLANTLGIPTEKLVVDIREEQGSQLHHDDEEKPVVPAA